MLCRWRYEIYAQMHGCRCHRLLAKATAHRCGQDPVPGKKHRDLILVAFYLMMQNRNFTGFKPTILILECALLIWHRHLLQPLLAPSLPSHRPPHPSISVLVSIIDSKTWRLKMRRMLHDLSTTEIPELIYFFFSLEKAIIDIYLPNFPRKSTLTPLSR